MKNTILFSQCLAALAGAMLLQCCQQKTPAEKSTPISLFHAGSLLTIDAWGGAITSFKLAGDSVNPFTWALQSADMPLNNQKGAPFKGHFLCLGRWGAPTEGEMTQGIPHNGEAGNIAWKVDSTSVPGVLIMGVSAPLDGISAERKVEWIGNEAVWKATETVQSTLTVARPFNMVQHATIGYPFLDTATRVYTNATDGFLQAFSYPNPQRYAYKWPDAYLDSTLNTADLRSTYTAQSYVSTHVFADSIGWIVAVQPATGLCLGYIWHTREYPWVNIWHEVKEGKPWAKGLEFGTTGIGRSYQDLMAIDSRFMQRPSFFMLDAGERISKSYHCFLTRLPSQMKTVDVLRINSSGINLIDTDKAITHKVLF